MSDNNCYKTVEQKYQSLSAELNRYRHRCEIWIKDNVTDKSIK